MVSAYLNVESAAFDFRDALLDDEGDSVCAVFGYLGEVDAEELQLALQLLMAALDGERLQTFFVAGQRTLEVGTKKIKKNKMEMRQGLLMKTVRGSDVTSSHSAPKTTRLSHSRHLDGARSFLSLCVCAALDI